ncbi:MAG: tRNA (guanosine(37)-N1)-methyltransferase TrmD, partial [Gammaproteobacteria bacterium]
MRIDVVTLFPDLVRQVAEYGVTGRAVQRGLLSLHTWNPRDYTHDRHRTVDDRPYGGGPGMLMRYEPLRDAIRAVRAASPDPRVIYLSPQGRVVDQALLRQTAAEAALVFVAGRYEGIDERLLA